MKIKGLIDAQQGERLFYQKYKDVKHTINVEPYRRKALKAPPAMWQEKLEDLVDIAHKRLWKEKEMLANLDRRGIPGIAVKAFRIGYNSNKTIYKASDLGFKEKEAQGKDIAVFAGILIPTFDLNSKLIRIKIRRLDWKPEHRLGKYLAVSGSMGGLNLIGNRKSPHMIIVESELDAYAAQHAVQNKALVVAVGSNTKTPDLATDYLIKRKNKLIVIYDNDSGGEAMLKKWQRLYKKTQGVSVPVGKDIGEAFEQGYDVRGWLDGLLA